MTVSDYLIPLHVCPDKTTSQSYFISINFVVIVVSSMYILVADLDGQVLSAISVLLAVDVVSAQDYVCMQLAMSSFLKFCSLRNAVLVLVYLHNFMCVYILLY